MSNAARLGAQAHPIQSHLSDFFPLLVDTNFYRHLANLLLPKKGSFSQMTLLKIVHRPKVIESFHEVN